MSYFLNTLSAELFNQKYPVGSHFDYFPVRGIPDSVEVVTRTKAWESSYGTVVVSVKNRAGGLSIKHMKPITATLTPMPHRGKPITPIDKQPHVKNQTED
ncbi:MULTISPECIES: hypothetical protein [Yersinia]|uniref:hypothetical protein n=1 Tax=Yersinia TaxID=629 RepID=UPI00119DD19B|nr:MULTISPECIES: hypothetical protein [Yersinia]MBS0056919.1 hypothetical protein [Yersinia sp. Marseille-Q3913]